MAVLEVNRFLTELAGLYEKCKEGTAGKAVTLTMKRSDLKPRTRRAKAKAKVEDKDKENSDDEYSCLVRAKHGKRKISTVVSAKDHLYFLNACNTICKAHMDALKRRDKKKKKKKKAKK